MPKNKEPDYRILKRKDYPLRNGLNIAFYIRDNKLITHIFDPNETTPTQITNGPRALPETTNNLSHPG